MFWDVTGFCWALWADQGRLTSLFKIWIHFLESFISWIRNTSVFANNILKHFYWSEFCILAFLWLFFYLFTLMKSKLFWGWAGQFFLRKENERSYFKRASPTVRPSESNFWGSKRHNIWGGATLGHKKHFPNFWVLPEFRYWMFIMSKSPKRVKIIKIVEFFGLVEISEGLKKL